MKLSLCFAALASLLAMSNALPFDPSYTDLDARDFGEVDFSNLAARDLGEDFYELAARDFGEHDYYELAARDFDEFEDLFGRDFDELEVRAKPAAPAKAPAKAPTKSTSKKSVKKIRPKACKKRAGECLNLFVVWYQPLGNSKRHWSLFLTSATAVPGATGTVYQVVDDRFGVANFKPEKRASIQASSAGRYEGAKLLGTISVADMDEAYNSNKDLLLEMIADHNKDRNNVNPADQSNCQHWTKDLVGSIELAGASFSGVPT